MRCCQVFVCLLAAVVASAGRAAEPTVELDQVLRDKAGDIVKIARDKQCKSLGVLKFRVREGDGPWNNNAGDLNMNLARRLSVAVILALPADESIGMIGNANEVLAADGRANHFDAEDDGRITCFKAEGFVTAWGDPKKPTDPDLFITGSATLSKDLTHTTIQIRAFGRDGKWIDVGPEFTVLTSPRTLVDTGHAYLLTPKNNPEIFSKGVKKADLYRAPAEVSTKPTPASVDLPIEVGVYYGTELIPIENGKVREPDPSKNEADKNVWFQLKNVSKDVYGVVLKINGVNTIFEERDSDIECHKWILQPGETVKVKGFQTSYADRIPFRVQSGKESEANEFRYGEQVGMFSVTAFRAKDDKTPDTRPPAPPPPPEEESPEVKVIGKGLFKVEGKLAESLKVLQEALREKERQSHGAKGLVVGDAANVQSNSVKKVSFEPWPRIPVMSLPIRYYQPRNGK